VRGGIIAPHRAMLGMAISRRTILAAAALGLGGAAGVLVGLNPLAELWARTNLSSTSADVNCSARLVDVYRTGLADSSGGPRRPVGQATVV
jgi:hypothetical protein